MSRPFIWDEASGAWVVQFERGSYEKRRVYDGMDVVQERNEFNQVTATVTRAGNIGGILARSTFASSTTGAGATSYFAYDLQGNVTTLTDSAGNVVGSYTYDAWGNVVASSGARAGENPYRFSTKEALGGLYHFGFRFYNAGTGRWLNRDPIRESGGVNLYAGMGNDPVDSGDEYGLQPPVGIGIVIAHIAAHILLGNERTAGPEHDAMWMWAIGPHGKMPNPRPGWESHHGVMSQWMENHYKNYNHGQAPAILMPTANHGRTKGLFNTWRASMRRAQGGTFEWDDVTPHEARRLAKDQMNVAGVPRDKQAEYWKQFRVYEKTLNPIFKDTRLLSSCEIRG